MLRLSLTVLLLTFAVAIVGCSDGPAPTAPTKASPNEGMGRPRPGDDGKIQKSDTPKGALKPVAD